MDLATYAVESAEQEAHWWFVGRRWLFGREIEALIPNRDAAILDVGTSTGTNLAMLRDLGYRNVRGLDLSREAIAFCESKGLGPVHLGDACQMPFEDGSMDLVLATDVIEHLDDDLAGLREIARVLKPGGKVLISVPAFPSLWGLQDRVAHHRRRYRMKLLRDHVERANLRVSRAYHFNFILFLPIWLARRVIDLLGLKFASEAQVNNPPLNGLLSALFHVDLRVAPILRPSFGVSIFAVAERHADPL